MDCCRNLLESSDDVIQVADAPGDQVLIWPWIEKV